MGLGECLQAAETMIGYPLDPSGLGEYFSKNRYNQYRPDPDLIQSWTMGTVDAVAECWWPNPPFNKYKLDAEREEVVALHFSGLVEYCAVAPDQGGKMTFLWVDLNPRKDGLTQAQYVRGYESGLLRQRVFTSFGQALEYEHHFGIALDPKDKGQAKSLAALVEVAPVLCETTRPWIEAAGIALPPIGSEAPQDSDGDRLFAAYDAFLPIARCLVQRSHGEASDLDGDVVEHAEAVADDETYPPHLLLRLLSLALSGSGEAKAYAERVLNHESAVGLTRRWANMLLASAGPFASDDDNRFGYGMNGFSLPTSTRPVTYADGPAPARKKVPQKAPQVTASSASTKKASSSRTNRAKSQKKKTAKATSSGRPAKKK